jgi:hypothetical protein
LGEKLSSKVQKFVRSRAAAGLFLLALTAHAFVAGATHLHGLAQPGARTAQAVAQSGDGHSQGTPLGGDEKQCLLCRLQRNFVTDLQHAALLNVPPPARTHSHELPQEEAALNGSVPRRQGRAPPSVQS